MITLIPDEARVLGVLIEKSLTTPNQYPLSLNAVADGRRSSTYNSGASWPVVTSRCPAVHVPPELLIACHRETTSAGKRHEPFCCQEASNRTSVVVSGPLPGSPPLPA